MSSGAVVALRLFPKRRKSYDTADNPGLEVLPDGK